MDSKGIDIQGLYAQLPLQIRMEKRSIVAIKPVKKTGGGEMKSVLDQDRSASNNAGANVATNPEEAAQLAADLLAAELKAAPDLEVEWTLDKENGILVVEIRDKFTGEVLRQIPPEEILAGEGGIDPSGLLLNKTA